ncbi:MAG TPA: YtxH domain-containing protein [Anaerolineales bacterium]|nr:YtxH domain-containing protein [Anaerolineales bacterium]
MKYLLGFLMGALIGSVVALLFAPSSGEELRTNIKTRAESEYTKLQDEMQKGMNELRSRMDKLSSGVKDAASQTELTDELV